MDVSMAVTPVVAPDVAMVAAPAVRVVVAEVAVTDVRAAVPVLLPDHVRHVLKHACVIVVLVVTNIASQLV